RIDISDQGMGIAEAEQSQIFARFYRSPAVSGQEGVGLGLFLAREILAAGGGYIKVSAKPGQGAVFSVFLPTEER
ncbi:MAG: sensor histidine kinase, partial [Desulfitobacterium hafniense]